jgi:hypothetical protein
MYDQLNIAIVKNKDLTPYGPYMFTRGFSGEICNVFDFTRRKNEWTNHAIAWYKHAI